MSELKLPSETITSADLKTIEVNETFPITNIIKYFIIIIILGLLVVNIIIYSGIFSEDYILFFKNIFKQFIPSGKKSLNVNENGIKKTVDSNVPIKKIEDKGQIYQENKTILKKRRKEKEAKTKGFCYIGRDNCGRNCAEVNHGDVCMSGDIFPTIDICINPNLRN